MEFSDLKKYVGNRIEELCSIDAYSINAPEDTSSPFIVFAFTSSSYEIRQRADYILEVDFWNYTESTEVIAAQAELLKAGFNYYWQSETEGYYQSHLVFMSEIPAGSPNIRRINQRYLLKVR